MRLTRLAVLTLVCVLTLASSAAAQSGPPQAGGVITSSVAVASASPGTGAAQTLLSQVLGAGYFNSQRLHFVAHGLIGGQVSSPGTLTVTVALGSTPTVTLLSAVTLDNNMQNVPFSLDCTIAPLASGFTSKNLACALEWTTPSTTTVKRYPGNATGTITQSATQTFTVTVTFSNSTNGTGMTLQDWAFVLGN